MEIYNTVGAARYLQCGIDNIHKLVSAGKLKGRVYGPEGVLIERRARKQGQGMYFLRSDLDEFVNNPQIIHKPRKKP